MLYYKCPSRSVLNAAGTPGESRIYKADDIAAALTAWGLPCVSVAVDIAPQVLTYHFDLKNPMQRSSLKRYITSLSAVLHTKATETASQKAHFAIAINRPERVSVPFGAVLTESDEPLTVCIGCNTLNEPVTINLAKAPHVLIAGETGSGKSVCLNTIINALLYNATPNDLRLLMVDTKRVELSAYNGLPHLYAPIAQDGAAALYIVQSLNDLMRERMEKMSAAKVRHIDEMPVQYPHIVLIIDELADLMLMKKDEIEPLLVSIAQLGRAAGIHLILATQRPTVNVVTGLLKANIPCRIALQTASIRDSMTILDHKGAEQLTGRGDAILKRPDRVEETRLQVAYISDKEIENITAWWKSDGVIEK